MAKFEVCANSVTSALAAQNGGAMRVELCANLHEGGTTPSYGAVVLTRKNISIELYPIIRPRPGDFLYTDLEYSIMELDVKTFIATGCDGISFGILNADGSVDKKRCSSLIILAKAAGLGVTFHRAFDMAKDQFKALEDLIDLGCDRILTSGGKSTAIEGASNIVSLIKAAAGRISIMPGGGINEYNVADIINFTGATEFHATAKTRINSGMAHKNLSIMFNSFGEEYTIEVTDSDRVKNMLALIGNSAKPATS